MVSSTVGYLFDMDGTLVDSHAVVEAVWTEFCERHGLDPRVVISFAHGRQAGDTVAHFLPALSRETRAELVSGLVVEEVTRTDGIVEVPGARRLLAALAERGAPVAIVTSAPRELAIARLNAAGVGIPDVLVAAEDVERGKPDPSCYLLAAQRLGVPIAGCVVFEDAEAGLAAGVASGGRTVVVGGHVSATTDGLERIRDYTGAVPGVEHAAVTS
ncbi:HAD-IA family hydrolase [Leifsonia shinshuensis]|uniref:HAD-IA family hydrolase n=1 Tax=Leifsonia shinshuensis TaxID=150026 RepID=UPI001F513D8D|nr:HAD-IA family hydrolase [Leifsonia shinshuensis]